MPQKQKRRPFHNIPAAWPLCYGMNAIVHCTYSIIKVGKRQALCIRKVSDFNNTEDMDLFVNVINSAQIKDTADDFKNRHNNGEANRQNIHRKSKRGNVKPTPSRNKRNPSKNKDYVVVKKSVKTLDFFGK